MTLLTPEVLVPMDNPYHGTLEYKKLFRDCGLEAFFEEYWGVALEDHRYAGEDEDAITTPLEDQLIHETLAEADGLFHVVSHENNSGGMLYHVYRISIDELQDTLPENTAVPVQN